MLMAVLPVVARNALLAYQSGLNLAVVRGIKLVATMQYAPKRRVA